MFMHYWIYRHMDKQKMEIKENGNGNWKLKTEIKTQLLHCCIPRMLLAPRHPVLSSLPVCYQLLCN